ncbi:acyl carrier protein [Streptosporangium sp. NPDC000239]|uniref:Acyl carrier protein n=1 Tax=Streptosporangium jomthongense TaxID=1193683 RepID=A0ABV8FB32_9ACTN
MTEQIITAVDKEELRTLIAATLDVDVAEVTDEAHFVEDLGVDSLMALEITVNLEKKYQVRIDESEVAGVTTLESTYALLGELLRKAAG